ncbi:hypothetical protein NECAME_17772 [Necator americanus]|uniref:Uncharacterized protein n=1 Tax=Necator americanus TaxID=51031 RepID=W2TKP2_NECAM|nr:hypothetical protein NECAME_17772 [Necator americanus]ETN82189.1 hypothetical protein NECAME_17772 [Necator americanus]
MHGIDASTENERNGNGKHDSTLIAIAQCCGGPR